MVSVLFEVPHYTYLASPADGIPHLLGFVIALSPENGKGWG